MHCLTVSYIACTFVRMFTCLFSMHDYRLCVHIYSNCEHFASAFMFVYIFCVNIIFSHTPCALIHDMCVNACVLVWVYVCARAHFSIPICVFKVILLRVYRISKNQNSTKFSFLSHRFLKNRKFSFNQQLMCDLSSSPSLLINTTPKKQQQKYKIQKHRVNFWR